MSRTERANDPRTVAYYRRAALSPGARRFASLVEWWERQRSLHCGDTLRDGLATAVPTGNRFKATYRRMERRQRNHALRVGDTLTATAPEKVCLWKQAWY